MSKSRLAPCLLSLLLALVPQAILATDMGSDSQPAELSNDCELAVDLYPFDSIDVLDPDFPQTEKLGLIENIERQIDAGCTYPAYVLGTLLRFGPELPGNPLAKDPSRAADLIERRALAGYSTAYADLAELALAGGEARLAMQWTQVYLYLMRRYPEDGMDFDRAGYNASLLLRATVAWRDARQNRRDVDRLLNDYLSRHRQSFDAMGKEQDQGDYSSGRDNGGDSPPELQVEAGPSRESSANLKMKPGYAVFLLEVQPDGSVSRIVPETFSPTPDAAYRLRPLVEGFVFKPFQWHEAIVVRVPVQYGYRNPGIKIRRR